MAVNKSVIVTGASRGIGAAAVNAFLHRGYSVVGTSRSAAKASPPLGIPIELEVTFEVADQPTARTFAFQHSLNQ
jgi:NAD(P)-dependent dehydrogenase (short-subunit alcohol dehydrogenase family)